MMDLATIEMERPKAREAFLEYRAAVRRRHDAEDAAIMRGYRALADGKQLLRLTQTLTAGGTTSLVTRNWNRETTNVTVPRLAVARASATKVWTFGIDANGRCEMRTKRDVAVNNQYDRIIVPNGTFEAGTQDTVWTSPRIAAIVPNVPPALRPATALSNYHVLFEAEWALDPEPPIDPALIKRLGGDLWVVVATWDLTELERAVLAGTRG